MRESDSASTAFSHIYGTRYGYDLEGRRLWMKHPATVAAFGIDSVAYAYDALSGMLNSVLDPYGNRFGFSYDAALRLSSDTATMTTGTVLLQTRSYDNESRMTGRQESQNGTTFIQDALNYDARNKEVSATFLLGGAPATEANTCSKVGALAQHLSPASQDTVITDALGHQRSHASHLQGYSSSKMVYDAGGSAELMTVAGLRSGSMQDTTINTYNLAGALWTSTVRHEIATAGIGHPIPYFTRVRTWSRYGSNQQLLATETIFDTVDANGAVYPPAHYFEREEYRYDALGRRIWRRLVRPQFAICHKMAPTSGCYSIVERTVWDGDQVLWEIRSDGDDAATPAQMELEGATDSLKGRVMYTHGAGIDHPLSIGRMNWLAGVIVPQYDWRGNATSGYCTNASACAKMTWPEQLQSSWAEDPKPSDTNSGVPVYWAGNLIDTRKDGSGYIYMRNRYYDPSSGRFTQVDPIGLAGGLNAYGFVGGDPVNYSDPFGLCPGIAGTNQASVDDCPDESKRTFWDRFLNGPRYGTANGKRVPVLSGTPIPIGPAGGEAEGLITAAERGEAIETLKGTASAFRKFFKTGNSEGLSKEAAQAYKVVAKWAVQQAGKLDKSGTQAKRLKQIEDFLQTLK